ncbi:hypothetical protein ACTGYU_07485, partial [Streptococcus suis]
MNGVGFTGKLPPNIVRQSSILKIGDCLFRNNGGDSVKSESGWKVILFKKQKLTYNRFMKLTIEQTKELKTYLKDKTYSPFHRRLQV